MKVKITSEGIYNSVRPHILSTKDDLSSARSVSYDCPSGFAYASFVRGLSNEIYGFTRELEFINNTLYSTDFRYRDHDSNKRKEVRNLEKTSLLTRKGL